MFPKEFKNDATSSYSTHQAIQFISDWPAEKITKEIVTRGLSAFLERDNKNRYATMAYKDGRISGVITMQTGASCCAFTQHPNYYYLFPFHENELKSVGLDGDDLIRYIKTFNDMKVGFNYLYFGKQEGGPEIEGWFTYKGNHSTVPSSRYPSKEMHWVGVPKMEGDINSYRNVSYLHWIMLRQLINDATQIGAGWDNEEGNKKPISLAYYNMPRIMMHLIDEYKVDPFRAFMYTQAFGPWRGDWNMTFSSVSTDLTQGVKNENPYSWNKEGWVHPYIQHIPDLGVTKDQFKQIWYSASAASNRMNGMLTQNNNVSTVCQTNKWTLKGKHSPSKAAALFHAGKIKEAVEYLDEVYGLKSFKKPKKKTDAKAIRTVTRKTPATRKRVAKSVA